MNAFSKNSKSKLETCHEDLQKIFNLAISRTKVDFGISEGHRDLETQYQYFKEGKSKISGINSKGKHNYYPSLAVDFFVYHPEVTMRKKIIYDTMHLSYLAGIIDSCAAELFDKGEITHLIRWGGNWDSDGVIVYDQTFNDLPHVELIKP